MKLLQLEQPVANFLLHRRIHQVDALEAAGETDAHEADYGQPQAPVIDSVMRLADVADRVVELGVVYCYLFRYIEQRKLLTDVAVQARERQLVLRRTERVYHGVTSLELRCHSRHRLHLDIVISRLLTFDILQPLPVNLHVLHVLICVTPVASGTVHLVQLIVGERDRLAT